VIHRRVFSYVALGILIVALTGVPCITAVQAGSPDPTPGAPSLTSPDLLTPICSTLLYPIAPLPLSDGQVHLVYDLLLTNWTPEAIALADLKVIDAAQPDRVLARWERDAMAPRLLHRTPAEDATTLAPGETVAFIAEVAVADGDVPSLIAHELTFAAPFTTTFSTELSGESLGEYEVTGKPVVIGLPFAGDGWTAFEFLSLSDDPAAPSHHRISIAGIADRIVVPQRFAVDWMRVDQDGKLYNGDPNQPENWVAYGAPLLAVADGTVVEAIDRYPDSPIPYDESALTLERLAGNRVILQIGDGLYALYAHLKPGSVTVQAGDYVQRGESLGELGQSGNSTAPHLHFHIMDRPSASGLGGQGVPYVFDSFAGTAPGVLAINDDGTISFNLPEPVETQIQRERMPVNLSAIGGVAESEGDAQG